MMHILPVFSKTRNRTVYPKITLKFGHNLGYLLSFCLYETCMNFILLWNTEKDILNSFSCHWLSLYEQYTEAQTITFLKSCYVPQKKEGHTVLEWYEDDNIFILGFTLCLYPFNIW